MHLLILFNLPLELLTAPINRIESFRLTRPSPQRLFGKTDRNCNLNAIPRNSLDLDERTFIHQTIAVAAKPADFLCKHLELGRRVGVALFEVGYF